MKKNTPIILLIICKSEISKTITIARGKVILLILFLLSAGNLFAQKDLLIKKDSTEVRCNILKENKSKYTYSYINSDEKVLKTTILKTSVSAVHYDKFEKNLIANELFDAEPVSNKEEAVKSFHYSFGIGINLSNILELNTQSGANNKSFSFTSALDLGLDYYKEGNKFAMSNELHWNLSIQKSGFTSNDHFQKASDDLTTLHDFSHSFKSNSKWNVNLIAKTNTSIFTIYDGNYFKDYLNNGKIQGFINPYQVTLSPGIKYQPNDYFRFSLSPYSVQLFGLTNQQIANTGYYTQTYDVNNDYDLFVFDQLGAELNIWYDRKYKKWLEMQYRIGISSDYFSKSPVNALIDGLFITKFKIIKNVSLSHRAILKGDFTSKPFKPYYKQTILLSYSKIF